MSSIELCAGPSQVIVVTTAGRLRALICICRVSIHYPTFQHEGFHMGKGCCMHADCASCNTEVKGSTLYMPMHGITFAVLMQVIVECVYICKKHTGTHRVL